MIGRKYFYSYEEYPKGNNEVGAGGILAEITLLVFESFGME